MEIAWSPLALGRVEDIAEYIAHDNPDAAARWLDELKGLHDIVMREASAVVTHGGHGTVMRALVHGRPMLIMPHGRDQDDNAVRVTARGAGLVVPATAPSDDIHAALQRLLHDPDFARSAARLGGAVAAEAEQVSAAIELEALVLGR